MTREHEHVLAGALARLKAQTDEACFSEGRDVGELPTLIGRSYVPVRKRGRCVRCGRSRDDGVVLQVHHKVYASGRLPWEYGHTECETLCRGCHAQEHGKIMPQSDWTLIGSDDLGDLGGHCEFCDTELRYIYAITHPKWGSLAVGTDCCDRLTMSSEASEHHARLMKEREKRARFLTSTRWKWVNGAWCIKQRKMAFAITGHATTFRISINGHPGRSEYGTLFEAKLKVFELLETRAADDFVMRRAEKFRKEQQAWIDSIRRLRPGIRKLG
jgi:hypothetical protein